MRNTITGIVETAAVVTGLVVKKGSAANGCVKCGAGEKALGIVDSTDIAESTAIGEQATIAVDGLVLGLAGGTSVSAVSLGDDLVSDANGKLIKAAGSATHNRVAIAMEGNTGVDNLFKVKVVIDEVII